MASRPIGPAPETNTFSPAVAPPRFTACMAMEIGSDSGARSRDSDSGTR